MLFSAELPWCCFMCRKQMFSEWPETPRNILEKIIKNPHQRWRPGGPHPSHEGGAPPLGRAPYLVGPLETLRRQFQLYIFASGEKKIREKKSSRFMIRSRRQALKPLGRADLESVQGSGEGNSSPLSSSTILHHQFHDAHRRAWDRRLAGRWWVGWDLSCNRVSFVRVWSLVSTMFWD